MKNKGFIAFAVIASIVAGAAICIKKGIIVFGENNKQGQKTDEIDDPIVSYTDLNKQKDVISADISERHAVASDIINEITTNVFEDKSVDHKLDFEEMDSTLDELISEE